MFKSIEVSKNIKAQAEYAQVLHLPKDSYRKQAATETANTEQENQSDETPQATSSEEQRAHIEVLPDDDFDNEHKA
jgi:hypothetical protein